MSNLLAQNKELKRLKKEAERRKLEDAEEKEVEDAEAQARAVEEFEKVQAGLSARSGSGLGESIVGRSNGKVTVEQDVEGGNKGVKRKLELDEAELKDLAQQNGGKRRVGDDTKDVKSNADSLPAFWVPGKIPDARKADLKVAKQHPTCPAAAADAPHDFTLKSLVTVHFHEDAAVKTASTGSATSASEAPTKACPSCNKALSNATKAVLAKPCGHVLCKPCSEQFQKPLEKSAHHKDGEDVETVRCYVCQEDVTPGRRKKKESKEGKDGKEGKDKIERGLVVLSTDGTGFAGGGNNVVKREGVVFQC